MTIGTIVAVTVSSYNDVSNIFVLASMLLVVRVKNVPTFQAKITYSQKNHFLSRMLQEDHHKQWENGQTLLLHSFLLVTATCCCFCCCSVTQSLVLLTVALQQMAQIFGMLDIWLEWPLSHTVHTYSDCSLQITWWVTCDQGLLLGLYADLKPKIVTSEERTYSELYRSCMHL